MDGTIATNEVGRLLCTYINVREYLPTGPFSSQRSFMYLRLLSNATDKLLLPQCNLEATICLCSLEIR